MYQDLLEYLFVNHLNDANTIRKFVCLNRTCYEIGQKYQEAKKTSVSRKIQKPHQYEIEEYYILPNGWKHGYYQYYHITAKRQLIADAYYIDDKLDGIYREYYYENQRVCDQYEYKNGKKSGKCLRWWPDGQLYSETNYVDDIMVGP